MLTRYVTKMMSAPLIKDVGPPPPDQPRAVCPGCGARGPLVVVSVAGRRRQVVHNCRCERPPQAESSTTSRLDVES